MGSLPVAASSANYLIRSFAKNRRMLGGLRTEKSILESVP